MIDYEKSRIIALTIENEDLRDAANAALILLGNLPLADQADPKVLLVVQQLEDALDPEQDEEDEDAGECIICGQVRSLFVGHECLRCYSDG